MSNYIGLNGNYGIAQPSGVKEEIIRVEHDRVTPAGVLHRFYFGTKWQATLTWPQMTPSDYSTVINMMNNGQAISYANTASGMAFTGFPNHVTDEFLPGSSFLRKFSVVIRQAI